MPVLQLVENPDILSRLASHNPRPALVIGFAAEPDKIAANAAAKRKAKGANWIVANAIKQGESEVFGSAFNEVCLITEAGEDHWQRMLKTEVAEKLVGRIIAHFAATGK